MTQPDQIRQETINRAAWSACDIFRGPVDANDYKDYILTMLFLKYLSDVWKDVHERLASKYPDDPKRIARTLRTELRFQLPEDASFYNLYRQRDANNIGDLINKALVAIEAANKPKLNAVFPKIDFNSEGILGETRERNSYLKDLLELFNRDELNLSPSRVSEDIIGNTYMYLIGRFASDVGKKAGEFYTPHKVSQLVAKLCAPKSGSRICDPACGSGGLLIEAAREVGGRDYALYGMELNGDTWALCKMNMFIHQYDSARIERCNALIDPKLLEGGDLMQFDYVVANPPFSLKKWGAESAEADQHNRFWRGMPPKSTGDYAFISHMIEVAKPWEGRVAVVVPHGVLFRGGAEGRIRQALIEENLLDAVIGLPENLFLTTSIPVAILIFDRSREKGGARAHERDVLFIDASREFQKVTKRNALSDEHINKIVGTYKKRKAVDKYAHLATPEEIADKDYNLNISGYLDNFSEESDVDVDAVMSEINGLKQELEEAHGKMYAILEKVQR